MKKQISGIAFTVMAFAMSAQAVVVVTTSNQTNGTNFLTHTFVPSSIDLINGLAPTASPGNFTQEGSGGTPVLTNGLFPSPITRDGGGPFQFGAFATGGNTGGTSVTYTLPTPTNVAGIDVYGGWQDGGRDQQSYSVFYSTASAPGTFLPLQTVNYDPPDPAGNPQVTRVALTDTTGFLALDVAAVRFDFNTTTFGYEGYAEIDILAPEPSRLALLGIAAISFVARRRRR